MRILLTVLVWLSLSLVSTGHAVGYDPMNTAVGTPRDGIRWLDLSFLDERRKRELPVRVYFPATAAASTANSTATIPPATLPSATLPSATLPKAPIATAGAAATTDAVVKAPVVLFSHGLGGSREGSAFLGRHWAARGYLAVFLQHPGSDEDVWKELPPAERLPALKNAVTLQTFVDRVDDVSATLDQLERWHKVPGHDLYGRVDSSRVGMSGHSYGAATAQAVGGQIFQNGKRLLEPRIKAVLIMSPSSSRAGTDPRTAFAAVTLPWLLMTGTKDTFIIGGADVSSRRAVYAALPAGGKYELVLDKAEHSAFVERGLPGDTEARNPNHHRSILALSTAFWDAYLLGNADARAWLDGEGVRKVIDFADSWQRK